MGKIKTTNIFLLSILYSLIAHIIVVYGIGSIIYFAKKYFEIAASTVSVLSLIESIIEIVIIVVIVVVIFLKYKTDITISIVQQNCIIMMSALFFEVTLAAIFIYTESFGFFLYGIGLTKIFTIPLIFATSLFIIDKKKKKMMP